jgi:hypothetical protein
MPDVVTLDELRATLNSLLQGLPPADRKLARDGIEIELRVAAIRPSPTEGDKRALLVNVGPGYLALRDADCDLVKELVGAGRSLLTKGPSLGLVGDLVALLFSIRRHGVELTVEQGLVLGVLRRSKTPLAVVEIGDALAGQRVGMTNEEVQAALDALVAALNPADRSATVVCADGRWRSAGV